MEAIVRRLCIGILACACFLFADVRPDVVDLFASIASALTAVNPELFMAAFDKAMPDYDKLKDQITALANQAEIASSIEPIKDEGDDAQRSVDLDWYLEVRSLYPNGPILHRRDVIHCDIRKQGKHWKIVSIRPMEFFAPAKLDK